MPLQIGRTYPILVHSASPDRQCKLQRCRRKPELGRGFCKDSEIYLEQRATSEKCLLHGLENPCKYFYGNPNTPKTLESWQDLRILPNSHGTPKACARLPRAKTARD